MNQPTAANPTKSLWHLKHADGVPYGRSLPATLIYWPQPGLSDDASRAMHEEAMREAAAALDALDRFYATGIVPHHVLDVLAAWDEEYLWHRVDLYLESVGCDDDAAQLRAELTRVYAERDQLKAELDELKACC